MSLKSIWERFIQNRPVYQKLRATYERATADLDEARHKQEGTTAKLNEVQHTLNKLEKDHERLRGEYDHAMTDLDKALPALSHSEAKRRALSQQYERTTVELERTTTALDGARTEHEQTKADLRDEQKKYNALHEEYKQTDWPKVRREYDELQEEHNQTTRALDESREEHAQKKQDFDKLSEKHDSLDQKYKLVSNLLSAKRSENEAFKKFKELFEGRFMAFANEESSLAEEAAAVEKLQSLEKRLEELVAFPHTFTKKSIAIGGGFSSGKSEFVNSFITNPDVKMPVKVEPATVIPSFVISNTEVSIKGFSRDGGTVDIAPAFYRQLSHNFVDTFPFELKDLMPSITVEVPLMKGLEHICLIDTPGYNPAGENTDQDKKTAAEVLKDRDALIWMIGVDATGTIPQSDLDFIKGMKLNGLPFYVVLNKADLKPESELEDILNEVKETLEDEGIEPVGICPYSSTRPDKYNLYDRIRDGQPLHDFFRSENQPKSDLEVELKGEIKSVFAMYENAIRKDENTAKLLMEELASLDLDILDTGIGLDEQDVLSEKIDNIKKSQEKDFTSIKGKMEEIKKDMLKAVDEVFWSLRPQSSKGVTRPPSAPASKSEQGSPPPSRSTVKRQGSIKGGKYIPTTTEQPEKPSTPASKSEQGSLPSRSTVKRQGSIKGGKYIPTDAEQPEKPSAPPAPKSEQGSPPPSRSTMKRQGSIKGGKYIPTEQIALRYINSATAEVFADGRLGISPQIAAYIVAYRKQHGPFQQLDELRRVTGIGSYTFKLLRQRLLDNAITVYGESKISDEQDTQADNIPLLRFLRGMFGSKISDEQDTQADTEQFEQTALRYINSATAKNLEELGISPQIAANIVAYRKQHGPFQQLDELKQVRGIGSYTFDRLRKILLDKRHSL